MNRILLFILGENDVWFLFTVSSFLVVFVTALHAHSSLTCCSFAHYRGRWLRVQYCYHLSFPPWIAYSPRSPVPFERRVCRDDQQHDTHTLIHHISLDKSFGGHPTISERTLARGGYLSVQLCALNDNHSGTLTPGRSFVVRPTHNRSRAAGAPRRDVMQAPRISIRC